MNVLTFLAHDLLLYVIVIIIVNTTADVRLSGTRRAARNAAHTP